MRAADPVHVADPQGGEGSAEIIGDGGSPARTLAGKIRRARAWIVLGALLLLVLLVGVLAGGDEGRVPLSPDNPAPEGARAAAQVLEQNGVRVIRAQSLEDAATALATSNDTLLLHDPNGWLSTDQLAVLDDAGADRIVLVEPDLTILAELGNGIRSAGAVPMDFEETLQAGCSNAGAQAAESTTAGGLSYRGDVTCFLVPESGSDNPAGTFVTTADGRVATMGNSAVLSNQHIDEHGNAALALQTLGSTPTLVWYQPTSEDLAVGSEPVSPLSLLPPFVNPLMFWLLVVALLAILWRARRLGPLVTEPLPVIVRSSETAAGRARLYQDAGAVRHAAETLRAGTLTRMAAVLRVPASSPRSAVVDAAAQRTGHSPADLDHLLNAYMPSSDADLVRWSQKLEDLEQEIQRA